MTAIIIASSIIVVMGTIDDIKPLSSIIRLLGQLLAAGIVMSVGLKVSFLPHTWWGDALSVLLTFIWILGIVNATKFRGRGRWPGGRFYGHCEYFLFLISLHLDQFSILLISSILIGASLGFLVFNLSRPRLFRGRGQYFFGL